MAKRRFSAELVRSSADLILLSVLRTRPMYGYEILVSLADRGDGQFQFKQGTLYPLLYRLEREGWIVAKWEVPKQGKKRKVYSLTKEGLAVQEDRVAEWKRFTGSVNSILKECGDE
jgi:DNA-binding PadR family transcriptional regulator